MSDSVQVLAFNAGSSSLKFELFATQPGWHSRIRGVVEDIGRGRSLIRLADGSREHVEAVPDPAGAAALILDRLIDGTLAAGTGTADVLGCGHRVVHGGELFSAPVHVTRPVLERLAALSALAPLHNAHALAVMDVVRRRLPDVPLVAVFDTAFFRDLPEPARVYALPDAWHAQGRIRRYGFHGIAHEYLSVRLGERCGRVLARVLSLQLGQGCSITALRNGAPVETSMGFTPLEGLIMGTRPGDLDPGILLHRARQGDSWSTLDHDLNRRSGLLGLSGVTADVRELATLEAGGHAGATLALAAFCHRIHKYLGAYAAVLGGVDAVVFGGGIGENAPGLRARICAGLRWLGLELDDAANARCVGAEARISRDSSAIEAHVIPVREEQAIARATLQCLKSDEVQ
jgi:acetate kinase